MAQMILDEGAAPSTPSAGRVAVYVKADGRLYIKDDTGAEIDLLARANHTGTEELDNNNVTGAKNVAYNGLIATSGTTGAVTADFSAGSIVTQAELTGNITYTFTPPVTNSWVTILGGSDGTSTSYTITWPGTVLWFGAALAATTTDKKWLFRAFWDGANYWATANSQA